MMMNRAYVSAASMVTLSPFPSSSSISSVVFRNHSRTIPINRKCSLIGRKIACSSSQSDCDSQFRFCRRESLLLSLSSSAIVLIPCSGSFAKEELQMAPVIDEINAYTYSYPVKLPSKKFTFKWVESRKPERYSSAAPLSPDARLRIVSERVDIVDNLIISVSIGPPNFDILKSKDKSSWTAKGVADSVLADKSALRVTSSQRMAESSVLDAKSTDVDGETYWLYEYIVRKSPTKSATEPNLFRRNVAKTAERDGFFYTFNASTLSKEWDKMGPYLEKTVESFQLLPPTESYVPPGKDPWRFW